MPAAGVARRTLSATCGIGWELQRPRSMDAQLKGERRARGRSDGSVGRAARRRYAAGGARGDCGRTVACRGRELAESTNSCSPLPQRACGECPARSGASSSASKGDSCSSASSIGRSHRQAEGRPLSHSTVSAKPGGRASSSRTQSRPGSSIHVCVATPQQAVKSRHGDVIPANTAQPRFSISSVANATCSVCRGGTSSAIKCDQVRSSAIKCDQVRSSAM